jgi:hypothetical protein
VRQQRHDVQENLIALKETMGTHDQPALLESQHARADGVLRIALALFYTLAIKVGATLRCENGPPILCDATLCP